MARLKALVPHSLDAIPPQLKGGVVAIGNFDGLHGGHRALLEQARREARRRGVPALALTFEPHPRTVFRPQAPVFRLTPLAAKARLMAALGLDGLVVADFNPGFAAKLADAFITDTLIGQLGLSGAVIGFNFRFGNMRLGDATLLAAAGADRSFSVTIIDQVCEVNGAPVSSSTIRDDLASGDVAAANARLGYRWFVVGKVQEGDRRGRELGYPTANLSLGLDCRLRHGIYAVRLQRADGSVHDGVASYGRRPTFDNGAPLLETYLFDFSGDLYGEQVAVSLVGWIRPELKFDSVASLVTAMNRDSEIARLMLAAAGPGTPLDEALAAVR
ncbi:MAG TPA: bifunctional riboflavin kinase/FAD synthetase [Bauldia sp.]|nr:bifunctional riboflavin kinase/FAD synthetase [Bauldia sp.]